MAKGTEKRTDWELVEAVKAGSHDAFAVLVDRYSRQVANLVYLSLGNRPDAEDMTQEVFFRFYQSIGRLTERDSVFPWIYRIASNLCIDESRKRAVRRVLSLDFLIEQGSHSGRFADTGMRPDEVVDAAQRQERTMHAIGRLSSQARIVLLMRDFEDLSYREIGEVLGLSVTTIKTRLFRARQSLAAYLREQEGLT